MSWIQTCSGVKFDLLAPRAEDVRINDIAHALAHLCRFAGHTRKFYSVAQHSVLVSYVVRPRHALLGLLHDAPEAYCADLPRPLKYLPALAGYREAEARVWAAVAGRFGLALALPLEVKAADNVLLATEQRDLLGAQVAPWPQMPAPLPQPIRPWSAAVARRKFLTRYEQLRVAREQRSEGAHRPKAARSGSGEGEAA